MCIIIYSPDGRIPKKHLKWSLYNNPHGWGYTFARDGEVVIRKGLLDSLFWKSWKDDNLDVPVIWHARIKTHGPVDIDNCHPFWIPGHSMAMAHNGIIHAHSGPKGSQESDTRLFIKNILQGLPRGFLDNPSITRLIADTIGYSKLAFMEAGGQATIINAQLGHWRGHRWYSNWGFQAPAPKVGTVAQASYTPSRKPTKTLHPDDDNETCGRNWHLS